MAVRKQNTGGDALADLEQAAIKVGLKLCEEVDNGTAKDKYANINAVRDLLDVLKK